MATLKELMWEARNLHSEAYEDFTDEELERMIRNSRKVDPEPSVKNALVRVEPRGLSRIEPVERNLTPQNKHLDKVKELQSYYRPGNGIFTSWIERKQSEGRGKHLAFITTEIAHMLEQGRMLEDAALESKRKRVEYELWIERNYYDLFALQQHSYLLEQATSRGVSVQGLEELTFDDNTARLEREKQELTHKQELELRQQKIEDEERQSKIKINEQRAKAEIETDNEVRLAHEKLKFQIIAEKLTNQQVVGFVQDLIDHQYIKIAEIEESKSIPKSAKEEIRKSRERIIQMYMEQQDETHNKLLGPRDAEFRGHASQKEKTIDVEIPTSFTGDGSAGHF